MDNYNVNSVLSQETATMENRLQEIVLMPKHNITLLSCMAIQHLCTLVPCACTRTTLYMDFELKRLLL